MKREEIIDGLRGHLKVLQDTPQGDAIADLTRLAWPSSPPFPLMGFDDPLDAIRPRIVSILKGWDYVGRQNHPGAVSFREGARALRAVLSEVEGEA